MRIFNKMQEIDFKERVTVQMSVEEIAYLHTIIGGLSKFDNKEIFHGETSDLSQVVRSHIYKYIDEEEFTNIFNELDEFMRSRRLMKEDN